MKKKIIIIGGGRAMLRPGPQKIPGGWFPAEGFLPRHKRVNGPFS